jgi:hypothetical protein
LIAAGGEPATVAVMTAMRERRFLGLRHRSPEWQTLPRDDGFRLFEERFVASPFRMVVVVPQFANFSARFRQTFLYLPFAVLDRGNARAAERAFLHACVERVRPELAEAGEAAEVLQLDGRFVGEPKHGVGVEWTAPFDAIARSGKVVSKRTSLAAIVPALRDGIGADEGGVYTPYGGDGVFHLLSM